MPRNAIIQALSRTDRRLLEPHLELKDLALHQALEKRRQVPKYAYFIEDGVASIVDDAHAHNVEVGVIGREGMTGVCNAMCVDGPADNKVLMQIAGSGYRIAREPLRACLHQSPTLHKAILTYAHHFMRQVSRTAVANARNTIEERLARQLLLAHDRVGDQIPLTHQFLSMMLGVTRSGITLAIGKLERRGLVDHNHGQIRVVNRPLLEQHANGCYDPKLRA